jgi:surface antigen
MKKITFAAAFLIIPSLLVSCNTIKNKLSRGHDKHSKHNSQEVLTKGDKKFLNKSLQHALEKTNTGHVTHWRDPISGHSGTITPTSIDKRHDGVFCRQYEQTTTINKHTAKSHHKACRESDHHWKTVQ